MLVKVKRGWGLPESAATPEPLFAGRRRFIKTFAAGSILAAAPVAGMLPGGVGAARAEAQGDDPSAHLYPVPRNLRYTLDRPLTGEDITGRYNNFYEFGSHKQIWRPAQALEIRPWSVTVEGLVEKPLTLDIDDLVARMPLEERLYRLRCVEAWSMTIPWSGFPMKALVDLARPLGSAKYVEMETFLDPEVARGQRAFWYPWPYTEGLTMAEATNELAFLVTGAYGKPLPKQYGAPIRLAVPWKYGFKSIKSIRRIAFTEERPRTFWEIMVPKEYGFWANVNPKVPHPRWSQARERFLGTGEMMPTQLYNGYGEFVAHLYTGLMSEPLFM
ncbi:MAG: protein-methionine-sulfoxide reductase catalytic subunit MsrP [Alphaproteobacteria bacterium]